jgi:hypothetical protein
MRTTTAKEFRDQPTRLLQRSEPFLITRRGKSVGLYLPPGETKDLPFHLRRELHFLLARAVREAREEKVVTDEEGLQGFGRSRK